ncbi:MAG: dipeptide epimerase [Chloroflexi bacterium]|nr:MAG: dipeptide epimerase [Chloroflexota bacterium]
MMTLSTGLRWEKIVLKLRNPFRLSYGVSETRQAFWLRLPGDEGWGEGTIPPYYGVADDAMEAVWRAAAESGRELPDDPTEIEAWVGGQGPAPARCALDLALYDRIARRHGLPLYELLGLPKPAPMPTSFTIAIDTPEAMARMAAENRHMPIIKVKLGSDDDESRLKAIRAARPDARLRVDANAGWSLQEAIYQVQALESYDLEMIEQPLPKDQIEAMGEVQTHTHLPLVADESVQTLQDVERLAAAGVRGINLKLMKVGGLTPGLRILKRARELGLQVMLGCMVETSLGTTAMAHLAGLADWLDLDAPLLVSNDPFDGVTYSPTLDLSIPDRPGIGVQLKNE